MKKLLILSSVVVSVAVAQAEMPDISAKADGYYDVTLTTKRLVHSEKTVSKTFTTSKSKGSAVEQFKEHYKTVKDYAGFEVIDLTGITQIDVSDEEVEVKKITFKYSYYDFKTAKDGKKSYVTKVVSDSNKGVYDSADGKVYLWDSASASKISVKSTDAGAIVEPKMKKDVEVAQSGFVAYQVPLAMDKQFIATDDNKAAGGFTGLKATAEDGTELNFEGFTAFGTGTLDTKSSALKSVAGNIAMKDPTDVKYGAYGTWKIQQDSSAKTKKAKGIEEVLRNKGCVELFMEKEDK